MLLLSVLVGTAAVGAEEKLDTCVACHAALPDRLGAPVEGMKLDVHTQHGLSCADCHGGDPTVMDMTAMDREHGYRGKPSRAEIPDLCARCHSDPTFMRRYNPSLPTNQRERYKTSVHGRGLGEGDQKVATCVSCHGVHGILPGRLADSPVYRANIPDTCGHCHSSREYMAEYGIPTDQVAGYSGSVHGQLLLQKRDFSAPVCTTCHDNHGASPPGLVSIADVCGQCHVNNAAFFTSSPHKPAFDRLGLPECVACHGNHAVHRTSDAMLGVGGDALCSGCHANDTPGYEAAVQMRQSIEALKATIHDADAALRSAEKVGMEVSDARYEFHGTDTILIETRTDVHRFSAPHLRETAAPGMELAERTTHIAEAALAEARARRRHLLLPLAVIAVLMVLLTIKLRRLEREPPDTSRS